MASKATETTLRSGRRAASVALSALMAAILLTFIAPSIAMAVDVYLNGVKVNGMKHQSFKGAKVKFDAQGNVRIEVDGIKIQQQGNPAGAVGQKGAALQQSYWLISDKNAPGMTQYDIDVHINGKFVRRVKSTEPQLVLDVTKFVVPGKNKVNFTAIKDLKETRKSFSAGHHFKLMLGPGKKAGNSIMIEKQQVLYKRTAADVQNHGDEQEFEAE